MLLLKLIKETNSLVEYNFYPEKKKEYGTIILDKNDGSIKVVKECDGDRCKIYSGRAIAKISSYFDDKDFLNEELIAWC